MGEDNLGYDNFTGTSASSLISHTDNAASTGTSAPAAHR